jgi:hypothetical protein
VSGCGEPTSVERSTLPAIDSSRVAAGVHNVLSAVVVAHLRDADSAAVRYRLRDDVAAADSATPFVAVVGDSAAIPVLGLLPERRYVLHVVARGAGGTATADSHELTTGALPVDLPRYHASGAGATPGFVLFAAGRFVVVIDNTGRVVWYRRFADGAGLGFLAQPTGGYTVRPVTAAPDDAEPWHELDASGETVRTRDCARGLRSRPHDILLEADGSHVLLCDESRMMDLTTFGGAASARVTGTVVQRVSATGALLFEWSPFEHFAITDLAAAERTGPAVNWTHGNSIARDTDGHLLVSFRNLNEITKIDAATGAVIWRFGGSRNEFTMLGADAPPFVHQHAVRAAAPGTLVLLDNRGATTESRAERYDVNEFARTARLVQSYGAVPAAFTEIGGSVQPLDGGRTLVSFGTAGRVEEFDATGQLVWRIEGNPGYVFRAQRIRSLYAPGVGTAR